MLSHTPGLSFCLFERFASWDLTRDVNRCKPAFCLIVTRALTFEFQAGVKVCYSTFVA